MTEETGTLAELNVKPGDVVRYAGNGERRPRTIAGFHEEKQFFYHTEQKWGGYVSMNEKGPWTLISRAPTEPLPYGHVRLPDGSVFDMTAERQHAFGMLTEEEQAAMKAHGGPYQRWDDKWTIVKNPAFVSEFAYRVKPQPVRKTVTQDMWGDNEGHLCYYAPTDETPVTVTYETVNGKVDWSTYRVEVK